MGYDASAHSIVGLRITPASRLYQERLVKVGKHNHPKEMRFDSTTGKSLWEERDVRIVDCEDFPDGIEVHHPDGEGKESPFVIVGVAFGADPGNDQYPTNNEADEVPSAERIEWILSAVAGGLPERLWDDDQFGLWSMIYHSY